MTIRLLMRGRAPSSLHQAEFGDSKSYTIARPVLFDAIYSDEELPEDQAHFLELNAQYSSPWPVITQIGVVPDDAAERESVDSKYPDHFKPQPGTGSPRE